MTKEISIEEAKKMYPGVDWETRVKIFKNAWHLEKILLETPEETEGRILRRIREYGSQSSRKVVSGYQCENYLALAGYVSLSLKNGTPFKVRIEEGQIKASPGCSFFNDQSQCIATAKGEEAVALNRLHNIERITINIVNDEISHAAQEKATQPKIPIVTEQEEVIPLVPRRKIKVKKNK
jgi:hypothetical protein